MTLSHYVVTIIYVFCMQTCLCRKILKMGPHKNVSSLDNNLNLSNIGMDQVQDISFTLQLQIRCFTCHFTRLSDHTQGMSNCDDPFQEEGIPTVDCQGLCGKTRTVIGNGEYMLIRSCLPNCKDMADEHTTLECCYGEKCNGSLPSGYILESDPTLCTIVFILGIVFFCACTC